MAPGLVQVFQKYRQRQVLFVSLTNMPRDSAESFVRQHSIPWPSGYAASLRTIAAFGALNKSRPVRGYEVIPTLYLVGPDGRVRWSDGNVRLRHDNLKSVLLKQIFEELDTRIRQAVREAYNTEDQAEDLEEAVPP